jgi:hypothetical protein
MSVLGISNSCHSFWLLLRCTCFVFYAKDILDFPSKSGSNGFGNLTGDTRTHTRMYKSMVTQYFHVRLQSVVISTVPLNSGIHASQPTMTDGSCFRNADTFI